MRAVWKVACYGERDSGSITAIVQTNEEDQLVLNCGIGKVLRSLISFLYLGKMTVAKKTR